MKKIINGKKYDTETAQRVAEWDNGRYRNDFDRCSEELYRKKTGEFFLYGEGGPMSRYARSCGQNQWCGGEEIIPLNYDAAQKWAEDHLDGDEYKKIFGEVAEDDSKVSATFRLSASTLEQIKRRAAEHGLGLSEYVESLLA